MNWYKIYKLSQIWVYKGDGEFYDNLKAIYEFEYKYSVIKENLNVDTPRKQNILNNLEEAFVAPAKKVVEVLKKTYEKWLENHALLNPEKWAEQRIESIKEFEDDSHFIDTIISEYKRYAYPDVKNSYLTPVENFFSEIINMSIKYINNRMPAFKQFLEYVLLPIQKDYFSEILHIEGLKEFNAHQGTKFKTKQQAINYIEKLKLDRLDIDELISLVMPDKKTFESFMANYHDANSVAKEMYSEIVFPLWSDYWLQRGIDKTRDSIQEIYDSLNSIDYNDKKNTSATISIALNTSHQTGEMLEYIEQDIGGDLSQLLDDLTKGTYQPEWDQELKKELNINNFKIHK